MSANIFWKTGMTKSKRELTTSRATAMTAEGYTMAPFTFFLRFIDFSMYTAKRFKIVSRIPPASPAATKLQ